MKLYKRIIPIFAVIAICISCVSVPAYASSNLPAVTPTPALPAVTSSSSSPSSGDSSIILTTDLADWLIGKATLTTHGFLQLIGLYNGECPMSEEIGGFHSWERGIGSIDGVVQDCFICKYCHQTAYDFFQDSYTDYVSELPANGIDSEGVFYWYPTVDDIAKLDKESSYLFLSGSPTKGYMLFDGGEFSSWERVSPSSVAQTSFSVVDSFESNLYAFAGCGFYLVLPWAGSYLVQSTDAVTGSVSYLSGSQVFTSSCNFKYSELSSGNVSAGYVMMVSCSDFFLGSHSRCSSVNLICHLPVLSFTPSNSGYIDNNVTSTGTTYNINTRPTSITGDYGVIGDNNEMTVIENQTIVNEEDNSVYNPVTNTSYDLSGWTYDYSTRTYNLTYQTTNEGGDTVDNSMTVTYGDENVTIVEGDTTYNVYYVYQTEPQNPEPTPSPSSGHTHHYSGTITQAPTCTLAGVKTFTCSECGDSYTQTVAALGHNWEIKTQVPTEYDENGALVTQGYTIYRCSRCGEEYKSEDGSSPPAVVSPGGDLVDSSALEEFRQKLVSFFSAVPQMFGDLTDFLAEGWSYIPDEVTWFIGFGFGMAVLLALWRLFWR